MNQMVKMKLKLDFISSSKLSDKSSKNRIDFILNRVKDGRILIMDGVLKSEEEMDLIKETMRRVDDGFPGIEVCSLKKSTKTFDIFLDKFMDQRDMFQKLIGNITGKKAMVTSMRTGLTLIGPAKIIRTIKKNPDSFSVMAEV